MPTTEPNRRSLVLGLAAAGALALAAPQARADAAARAQALVAKLAQELTALVNSGRSEPEIYAGFERILVRYADMPAVAASVLGPPWRSASGAERQAFVASFQHYLARRYGKQFRAYRDARIEIIGAREAGRAGVLVETRVVRPGQEDIAVGWQISDRSGTPSVVNLVIEGVSMLANERAEIGAQLEAEGGSVAALSRRLAAS